MKTRIDYLKYSPGPTQALLLLEKCLQEGSLDPRLLELVRMRASQINGCVYCIDLHAIEARANGETEQRLYALSAWQESPFFDSRERAALMWTEAVTLIHKDQVPDCAYTEARMEFNEQELVELTFAIRNMSSDLRQIGLSI